MSERKSKWDEPATSSSNDANSAAAAAAAAAAKIAAQFNVHHSNPASTSQPGSGEKGEIQTESKKKDREQKENEFVHDIEINDIRNRYLLTKAQTQNQIHDDTGANVQTKGLWYPDKSLATTNEPPLYLHISALTKESLDSAIEKVNEIIQSEMPQLIEDRQAKRAEYEQQRRQQTGPPPPTRRERTEERLPIGLENIRNFNVRAKVVGPQGMFVKYIQSETGTRVQIKGIGSGFIETTTGAEANEPMFISISGMDSNKVEEAKELAIDLLDAVRTEHGKAQQAIMQQWGPPQQQQQHGYGNPTQGGNYGDYGPPSGPSGHQGGIGGGYGSSQQGNYGHSRQSWSAQQQPPQPQGAAPPLPDDVPPPPPPEDAEPPLPPSDLAPAMNKPRKSPEELALDKYWNDYIDWEKSFQAYHNRLPTTEEGLQNIPSEYRRK